MKKKTFMIEEWIESKSIPYSVHNIANNVQDSSVSAFFVDNLTLQQFWAARDVHAVTSDVITFILHRAVVFQRIALTKVKKRA